MLQFSQQQVTDDHVFLTGRPPLSEYLAFVIGNTIDGPDADRAALANGWRAANDHVKALEATEAGWADAAEVVALPDDMAALATNALSDPVLQQCYALLPISIGMVELDRLVVYQKAINLGQIERIRARLGDAPSDVEVFRICVPLDRSLNPAFGAQPGGNGWTFVSPSNDLRVLGAQLVPPDNVTGFPVQGAAVAMLTIAVGYGVNLLSAARIEGRLVLTNGSHRAYALRELGITHAPCLIQEITRRDELELLGVPDLVANPDAYLTAARPPMLKDYFDPKLRIDGRVVRKDRHVQVGVNVTATDLPAPPRN